MVELCRCGSRRLVYPKGHPRLPPRVLAVFADGHRDAGRSPGCRYASGYRRPLVSKPVPVVALAGSRPRRRFGSRGTVIYADLAKLQANLDAWVEGYNHERAHQGKMCCGRTPMQTLRDGRALWAYKVGQLNCPDTGTTVGTGSCQIKSRLIQLTACFLRPVG